MLHGTVSEVRLTPVSDRGAVYYPVLIDVVNQHEPSGQWLLRPGLTATVDIVTSAHDPAWKMPTGPIMFV